MVDVDVKGELRVLLSTYLNSGLINAYTVLARCKALLAAEAQTPALRAYPVQLCPLLRPADRPGRLLYLEVLAR